MRISVAADHNGYELKNEISEILKRDGHDVIDMGPDYLDPLDDYPDYAKPLAESVSSGETERGIMVCGSGVGASVAANKVKGVRAAVCHDIYSAHQGVEHDDMNVVCLGARIIGVDLAKDILTAFIDANFLPEARFQRRLDKVLDVEKNQSAV